MGLLLISLGILESAHAPSLRQNLKGSPRRLLKAGISWTAWGGTPQPREKVITAPRHLHLRRYLFSSSPLIQIDYGYESL